MSQTNKNDAEEHGQAYAPEQQMRAFNAPNSGQRQKMSIGSLIHLPEQQPSEERMRASTLPALNHEKLPGIAGLLNEAGKLPYPPRSTSTLLGYQTDVMRQMRQERYIPMMMGVNPPSFASSKMQPPMQQQMAYPPQAGAHVRNFHPTAGPRSASTYNLPSTPLYNTHLPPKMSLQPQQQKVEAGQTSATLKYSHKMAERKRRKDMNDTFDELRTLLPYKHGNFSKWEILNGATEHVENLKRARIKLLIERETLHRELGLPAAELVKHSDEIL